MFPFWIDLSSGVWLPWLSAALVGVAGMFHVVFGAR